MSEILSGQLTSEFVRTLALAWKNLAAYPPGHPALTGSLEQIQQRLSDLRGPAGEVVFGIASDGLLYAGEKISNAHAQKFAHALYTRGAATLRFDGAATTSEIETFLRLLGVGYAHASHAPIWEALTDRGITNVSLQPVDYSAVQATDNLDAATTEPVASLWEEILRALLAGSHISAREMLSHQVRSVDQLSALIARYIESGGTMKELDSMATFGVQLTKLPETEDAITSRVADAIGLYVVKSSGTRKQLAVQQLIHLMHTLPEQLRRAVMQSVLRALATEETAGALLRELATALPHDSVLDGLRRLSSVTNLSSHALTLLESLASIQQPESASPPADAVFEEIRQLFEDEDIDRFNPPDHKALLSQTAIEVPPEVAALGIERLGDRVDTVEDALIQSTLTATIFDLIDAFGSKRSPTSLLKRGESAFRAFLAAGHFNEALHYVTQLRELGAIAAESQARLGSQENVQVLIDGLQAARKEKIVVIHQLIAALGTSASQNLLIALAEESNRSRRRRLFDFLASLGPAIVADATAFLADSRWYVVRNMIVLLRTVGDRTSLPEIQRCAQHLDLRVRLEAIKTLLAFDPAVPRALLEKAIHDPDPKLAEAAIALVANYGIKEGVDPLLQILTGNDMFGARTMIRIKAIKALAELGVASALLRMQHLFADPFLPWPVKEERYAAWESLASYPDEARKTLLVRGLKSRDSHIRQICQRLAPKLAEEATWSH